MDIQGVIKSRHFLTVLWGIHKKKKKNHTQGSYLFMPACFHHLSLLHSSVPPSTNPRERCQGRGAWTEESTHHTFAHWDTLAKSSVIWKQCNLPMLLGCISWHRAFNRLHCSLMSPQSSIFAQIMWCSARTNGVFFLGELMQHPLRFMYGCRCTFSPWTNSSVVHFSFTGYEMTRIISKDVTFLECSVPMVHTCTGNLWFVLEAFQGRMDLL